MGSVSSASKALTRTVRRCSNGASPRRDARGVIRAGRPLGLALILAGLPLRCSAGDEGRAAALPIRGGFDDTEDTAVVGIQLVGGTCTGSLIAPDVVLTAQHCVASVPRMITPDAVFGPLRSVLTVFISTRSPLSQQRSDFHAVARILIPPGPRTLFGQDIALLVLSEPVPPSEATPIAPRLDLPPTAGEVYSAVGYGATQSLGTDNGRRRRRDERVVRCVAGGCYDGGGHPDEWIGDDGPCDGDSGGPALDRNGRVIGVQVRGGVNCVSPTYTLVSSYAAWMRSELLDIARASGRAPPSWTTQGASDRDAGDGSASDASALADAPTRTDAPAAGVDGPRGASADAGATSPSAASGGGCGVAPGDGSASRPWGALVALVVALAAVSRARHGDRRAGRSEATGAL